MTTYYVKTTGNDTTGDGTTGNPWASLGKAAGVVTTSGDVIAVEEGDYNMTTSTVNVAQGTVLASVGVNIIGYKTTPGDMLGRPRMLPNFGGVYIIRIRGSASVRAYIANIEVVTGTTTGSYVFQSAGLRDVAIGCVVTAAGGIAEGFGLFDFCLSCTATGLTDNWNYCFNAIKHCRNCFAKGGKWSYGNAATLDNCISVNPSWYAVEVAIQPTAVTNFISYGSGLSAFYEFTTYAYLSLHNVVVIGSGAYGSESTIPLSVVSNFATKDNTSGRITPAALLEINPIILTADPFIDAANDDFRLNNTAGGGALLRGMGFSDIGAALPTHSLLDIGGQQHADAAVVILDDDAAEDVLAQIATTFPAGSVLDIYDAAGPADPEDAHSGNILVSITLPSSPWDTPSGHSMAKLNTWAGTAGNTGVPVSARLRNAADTKRADFTCTEDGGGGQVEIDTASITSGDTVTVSTLTVGA